MDFDNFFHSHFMSSVFLTCFTKKLKYTEKNKEREGLEHKKNLFLHAFIVGAE